MEENARYGNDIAFELARLHVLHGMDFTNQLKLITRRKEFLPVKDEDDIYSAISESDADYPSQLNAAQKAVSHGYRVFINMATDYNARLLALQIQKYFEWNPDAGQIMIFKGNKMLVITRRTLADRNFITTFTKLYNK